MEDKFLILAESYLFTSRNIFEMLVDGSNTNFFICDSVLPNFEKEKLFKESIKWSDFNVMVPGIFLYYHSIELLLKALLYKFKKSNKSHNSKMLLSEIRKEINKKNNFSEDELNFLEIIEKYLLNEKIENKLLKSYIDKQNLEDNRIYQSFRYPENISYEFLRYQFEEGKKLAQEIIDDINNFYPKYLKVYRIIES